jgi:hypothetical protein
LKNDLDDYPKYYSDRVNIAGNEEFDEGYWFTPRSNPRFNARKMEVIKLN